MNRAEHIKTQYHTNLNSGMRHHEASAKATDEVDSMEYCEYCPGDTMTPVATGRLACSGCRRSSIAECLDCHVLLFDKTEFGILELSSMTCLGGGQYAEARRCPCGSEICMQVDNNGNPSDPDWRGSI